MKRKKRLIVSLISLAFSISLMMFGVWASVNPTVSITGYVTFNVSSSQVSVTGTIIDGYDASGNAIAFLDGKNFHYQDYTDREKATLADWSINDGQPVYFKEDASGVTDIKLKFDFTNNSPFYTVAKFENVAATNNVNVTFDQQVIMDVKGGAQSSKSSTITYSVIDNSKKASTDINFTVTFERYLSDGQTFASFQQNFSNQKPLTAEEVTRLQDEFDSKKNLEKQNGVSVSEAELANDQNNASFENNDANNAVNDNINDASNANSADTAVDNDASKDQNAVNVKTNNVEADIVGNSDNMNGNVNDNANQTGDNALNNNYIYNNINNHIENTEQNLQNQSNDNRHA